MSNWSKYLIGAVTGAGLVSLAHAYGPGTPPVLNAVPPGFTACATDGKVCKVPAGTTIVYVAYGAGNKYSTAQGTGDFTCLPKGFVKAPSAATPQDLGVDDPAPGIGKTCYMMVAGASQAGGAATSSTPTAGRYGPGTPATLNAIPVGFAPCATDGKVCKVPAGAAKIYVAYGSGNKYVTAQGTGDFTCFPKGFVKSPSAATPQDLGVDDPASGVAKTCYVMAAAAGAAATGTVTASTASTSATQTASSDVKEKPAKTPIDPAQWVIDQAKKRKGKVPPSALAALDTLLAPAKGVFLIEEADEDEEQEKKPGAVIAVKGKFNWVRGFAATQGPSARLTKMARNMGHLVKKLGVSETVPMEVTLFYKGDGLDLEFDFKVFDGWKISGDLFPVAKPRAAFKELSFKMHAKLAGKIPEFSIEAEGVGFVQPTYKDSWVALSPAIEVNNEGELTFGGAFSGSCSREPNKDTESDKDCKGDWDVFKNGRITAKGGSLRISMEGELPKGLEASILNGRIGGSGSDGLEVTGAIRGEVNIRPGFGLVLKTKGTPAFRDFVNVMYGPYMKAGGTKNPLHVLYTGLEKLPNPKLPLSQQADIIITPTGFAVEGFDYPDPQIYANAKASSAGITLVLDSSIKADPGKFLTGDIAGSLPKGYVKFTENNDDFNNGIKKVAGKVPLGDKVIGFIMDKGFTFHAVTGTVNIDGLKSEGKGSVVYKLAGTERSLDDIPLEGIFDPLLLAEYVLERLAKLLTDPPEWVRKIPGATEALKAAGFVVKEAAVLAGDVGNLAKDLVTDPKALGKDAVKLGEDVAKGAIVVGSAAIDLGSKALASVESIFSGPRDASKDALHKNIPPFKKDQAVSLMCALEGGRCAFEGKRLVAYGAAGSFIFKENVTGGIDCTSANFGGQDPLPGSTKACYYPVPLPAPSNKCGDENGKCAINASGPPQDVYYGLGTMFAVKRCVTSTVDCSNSSFGADPTYGGTKSCYAQKSDCDPKQVFNFKCARENGRCTFEGTKDVAYGRDGVWTVKSGVKGSIDCNTGSFGGRDPVPGVKYCYIQAHELHAPQASEKCADENGMCSVGSIQDFLAGKKPTPQDMFYGADGAYAVRKCVSQNTSCTSASFGGDPAAGVGKSCYMRKAACAK